MDVDNASDNAFSSDGIDQALLQQFSCMGTSDKDELINELQKLLCGRVNYSTAMFFLDMNNWNLQGAVCSYLDTQTPAKLPSMAIVDFDPNDTDSVEPNVVFTKSWHILNNGDEQWPFGCYADLTNEPNTKCDKTQVAALKPGERTILTVVIESPATPGMHQKKWRLCTPKGSYFGDELWCFIYVADKCTVNLTEQLSQFSELGTSPSAVPAQNPFTQQLSQSANQESLPPDGSDSAMC